MKIHIFGKPLRTVKNPQASAAVKRRMVEKAAYAIVASLHAWRCSNRL
jgi:hypothetical protein